MAAVAPLRAWARTLIRCSSSSPFLRLPSSARFVNSDSTARLGLRFPELEPADAETPANKSRNEKKREAKRAVKWGMDLAQLPPPQIKLILKAAALEQEVFEALMLAKRLGPDVREGKRRQFNYIGRLLRDAQPELMDALIQASKDGDTGRFQSLCGKQTWPMNPEADVEFEDDDLQEECDDYLEIADRWFVGLVDKDSSITNEVYSLHSVDFDRQELRKLVRRVQSIQSNQLREENMEGPDESLAGAKTSLSRFLRSLAKKSLTM
ncbi:hypothetical protein EJ110_NYTH07787 [Nymphaea thermarum]|nr:hypothetical protein EJ110_NYTH07787 [Nymphaea thermarum]